MVPPITQRAAELGFVAVGFSIPREPPHFQAFEAWLAAGKHAGMNWLERRAALRRDPGGLLGDCRTIISLAYPYDPRKPATSNGFTVSRYAQPRLEDYHVRLRGLCRELAAMIERAHQGSRTRVCVDSAPLLERSLAWAAGLGFIGRNNALIVPGYGSYLYLAEILTTVPLAFTPARPMEGLCGDCRRCLEACPTGALEAPYRLDASRCLSYLSIEHRGGIEAETGRRMGDCFCGCDRCQEACPFNGQAGERDTCLPSTVEILEMTEEVFRERFGRTALARAGLQRLKANIRAIRA